MEFLKRFYDRRPIVERYLDGKLGVYIHARTGRRCWCLIYERAHSYESKSPMLVGVGQVSKRPRPIASRMRLQSLNHCLVFDRKSFETGTNPPLPVLYAIFNRKLRTLLNFSRIQEREFVNKIVQGSPQIIYSFTYKNPENRWRINTAGQRQALFISVPTYCRTAKGRTLTFDVRQVLLCPTYSRVGIVKRWLHGIVL